MPVMDRASLLLELGLRSAALPLLDCYLDQLWSANHELNLISRKMTFDELIDNHVIDCLLPLKKFPRGLKAVADFGSGGGLPGIVYALQFPETEFHLYEKSPRKQQFLKSLLVKNVQIHAEIPNELPQQIELITARAFKPLDVLLDLSRNYFKEGGHYFLLKARREKIEEEIQAARKKFANLQVRVEPLSSPVLDVERNLLQIP